MSYPKCVVTSSNENRLAGGEYNIVTFDPRGTGFTIPYQCPGVEAVDGSELPLTNPAGLNATFVTNSNQGELCSEEEYKLGGEIVGTAFVARDVDSIAQAFGEDGMIRYWGFSYGTLLGSTIAAMFPEKIDRMVLDGNINPTDYYHGTMEESVDNVDAGLLNFFVTCAEAGPTFCPLADGTSTGQELHDSFMQILNQLKSGELTLTTTSSSGNTVQVTYGDLGGIFFEALRSPSSFTKAADAFVTILKSSTGGTSRVLKREEFDPLAASSVDVPQALTAITCGDWDGLAGTLSDFEDWLNVYLERSKFGGDQLISILYSCATWKVHAREQFAGKFTDVETKTPILFINGPYDPVTPLTSAKNSSSGFTNSALLQTMGAGHCSTAQPSTCVARKVISYFQTGELPDVSQICQPNRLAWSNELTPSANVTAPSTNSTTSRLVDVPDDDEAAFLAAVNNLEHMFDKRDVEVPQMIHNVKRDMRDVIRARQASSATATLIPATCTPTAGGAQSTGSSSSSSGGSGGSANAAPQLLSNTHLWSVLAVLCISWLRVSI